MSDLKTELLFTMTADLEEVQDVGATPHGNRRIYYVTGGAFEGPKLKGEVLPGGGDWALIRPDGVLDLNVRATLRTDDGALIYTVYKGFIRGAPDSPDFYFRTAPTYETGSEKYGWLNQIVAVGVGKLTPTGVSYNVYEVL